MVYSHKDGWGWCKNICIFAHAWPNLPHLNPPEAWGHGHRCHRCQGSLPVYDFWAVGRASRHGDGSKLPMKFRDDWGIVVLHPAILGYF